jgi:DNA-binding response OmpR family regulator
MPTDSPYILLVEDDSTLARSMSRNLEARSYAVVTATRLADALTCIEQQMPALLLLDIDLPDGSGWDAARKLRNGPGSDVPIIVVSALRPNDRLVRELGCVGFLEKPFPVQSLLRQVDEALNPAPTPTVIFDA